MVQHFEQECLPSLSVALVLLKKTLALEERSGTSLASCHSERCVWHAARGDNKRILFLRHVAPLLALAARDLGVCNIIGFSIGGFGYQARDERLRFLEGLSHVRPQWEVSARGGWPEVRRALVDAAAYSGKQLCSSNLSQSAAFHSHQQQNRQPKLVAHSPALPREER